MANRTRGRRIYVRVSDDEMVMIVERMKRAGIINREAYIRKMIIDGYILHLDMSGIQKLIYLLSTATNNLNQIARRANETRNIYETDIKELQANYELLWNMANGILEKLAKI